MASNVYNNDMSTPLTLQENTLDTYKDPKQSSSIQGTIHGSMTGFYPRNNQLSMNPHKNSVYRSISKKSASSSQK
jgi:hypothetical protein